MDDFVLHHERVTAPESKPSRWLLVLHGIFGSGANWRQFCRSVAIERPDWGFVLVDQRGHGRSQGAKPPHDLDAMATDLLELEHTLGIDAAGVVGHSLGGKVALVYSSRRAGEIDEVWILDSSPSARAPRGTGPTREVLEMLEGLPGAFGNRAAFVDAVTGSGHSKALADWLAMNVRRARASDGSPASQDEHVLMLDLPSLRQILDDYYRRDLWPEVQRSDPRRRLHLVVGAKSYVWTDEDRRRLEALPKGVVHTLDNAGHWLHVDAPDELRALFVNGLAR
jgi:pimeloyl-ACP methyl ester carboxylesterase